MLGKCLMRGFYNPPEQKDMEAFFDHVKQLCVANDWDVLDFCLCMEHAKESAMVLTRWNYGEPCGPLRLLNIDLEGAS
jgi:hypothetical protein